MQDCTYGWHLRQFPPLLVFGARLPRGRWCLRARPRRIAVASTEACRQPCLARPDAQSSVSLVGLPRRQECRALAAPSKPAGSYRNVLARTREPTLHLRHRRDRHCPP